MAIKNFKDFLITKNWRTEKTDYYQSMQFSNVSYDSATKIVTLTAWISGSCGDDYSYMSPPYVFNEKDTTLDAYNGYRVDYSKYIIRLDSSTKKQYSFYVGDAKKLILYLSVSSHTFGFEFLDLTIPNVLPEISDVDRSLGDKTEAFSVSYKVGDVDNDSLIITERLNGNIIRTLNNAPKGQDLTINISRDQLLTLPLNVENKLSIEVNDGKGGVSYRNYTFKRTNTAPIISNQDKNLDVITAMVEKYTVNDMEGNAVNVVEKLDNVVLRNFAAGLGKEYTTTIDKDIWIKLRNGQHTYSVEATDSNNSKSTRVFSFTKKESKIDFTLAKPFSTDIKTSKILVTPSWELNGATAKIEVCNNAFDVNPTWEDITRQVLINRHYNFTNTTKTADKWGVNIRIYIEKDQASLAEVSIKGFGGAFE